MFSFLPAFMIAATIVTAQPAAAAPPDGVPSPDMEIRGPFGPLRGTLVQPELPTAPVVLIVPGSGATDRDGNDGRNRPQTYRLLADELATQGVASLRIDKRGMFGSASAIPNATEATVVEYARDAFAWIDAAKQRTGASCVWLLGHDEGGLVALLAAQKGKDICGLVLVGTPGKALRDTLKEQLGAAPDGALREEAFAILARLTAGRRIPGEFVPPPLLPLFGPDKQRSLIGALQLDPTALIANVRQPVLIVQGERDAQVSVDDAQRLISAKRDAALALLPNANHALKIVGTADRRTNVSASDGPDGPLAPGVAETIARFINTAR